MKKYITALCVAIAMFAGNSRADDCPINGNMSSNYCYVDPDILGDDCLELNWSGDCTSSALPVDSSCTTACKTWQQTRTQTKSVVNGAYATKYWPVLEISCNSGSGTIYCNINDQNGSTYSSVKVCASGYYGDGKTCTKCPANATCSGEGNTTFTCNSGYCNTGTACVARPANSTCSGSTFKCNAGYYKNGTSCQACPSGGTSVAGATAQSQCFIRSGASQSDRSGKWQYTSNCYYN